MATGSSDSTCQTIAATAPFSPRKPGNKACQNGAKATNASCINWVFAERSLHTGEVVGSIPTAPTIFQVFFRQSSEQTGTSRHQSARSDVERTWSMIAFCSPVVVSGHWDHRCRR
jgi:hypothetical protein